MGGLLKLEYVDNNLVIYYFDEIRVDNFVEYIIKCVKDRYNLDIYGLCTVNLYKDKIIILEIIKNNVHYYNKDDIDIHIINKNNKILYEIEDIFNVDKFYLYKNKYYVEKCNISECEFCKINYKDTDKIIKLGKLIVN